jgi:hypothetical protein
MNEPKAYYQEILAGSLDNGITYFIFKTGPCQYGLKLEDASGEKLVYGFRSSKANLQKTIESYLRDYR